MISTIEDVETRREIVENNNDEWPDDKPLSMNVFDLENERERERRMKTRHNELNETIAYRSIG
jgi:hypothetical protein